MMRVLLAACALMACAAAHAQRVEVPPSRVANTSNPVPVQAGTLIVGDISPHDYAAGPEWNADTLVFSGHQGEVVFLQARSEVPTLQVRVQDAGSRTGKALLEAPAKDAPVRLTLPRDGRYFLIIHATGPQQAGKYLVSFGKGDLLPALVDAPVEPEPPTIAGVLPLRAGQPLSRSAGAAVPSIETFQFIAGAGSQVRLEAKGQGPLVLAWYSPLGTRLGEATGEAMAQADIRIPADGLYFATVTRRDGDKPYQMQLTVTE